MSNSGMKGLQLFISDIRNAKARDVEEKRINVELAKIRSKFKDTKLDGYQKKKYICKLLYIYILGWPVSFGHLEAVNLLNSTKYSEKQIGYLAVTLMLNENHELINLVVNSIRKDLTNRGEANNCLALHAVANIASREMAESLASNVQSMLVSPPFIKKKAALCLLRLHRKFTDVVQLQWAERIIPIMDDANFGVALSVSSLILDLATGNPSAWASCYSRAAQRLRRIVVDFEYQNEYLYYKIPSPWLLVKFMQILQTYPPSQDRAIRHAVRDALVSIFAMYRPNMKNVQQNNALNAIMFEAIRVSIHLKDRDLISNQAGRMLGKFISSRETNVRYLGLEGMSTFSMAPEYVDMLRSQQDIVIASLRDRDVSVRRKALDVLFRICNQGNAKFLVNEMVRFLGTADREMRQEVVLKVAVLTEKYATESKWYIDIMLTLLNLAGDQVSDEVWHRIVQIITNNESLQPYATEAVLKLLDKENAHEYVIKVGGYVLGEYGHLVADQPDCGPLEQLTALHSKFNLCSLGTRALLLSTYLKFLNLFPEIKAQILQIFRQHTQVPDPELQQRAWEYLSLCTRADDSLLQAVCNEMPPYPERESALLLRLQSKGSGAEGRIKNAAVQDRLIHRDAANTLSLGSLPKPNGHFDTMQSPPVRSPTKSPGKSPLALSDSNVFSPAQELAGLDLTSPIIDQKSKNFELTRDWEIGYRRLITRPGGILYNDEQIRVGYNSQFEGSSSKIQIFYNNLMSSPFNSFSAEVSTLCSGLSVSAENFPNGTLAAKSQSKQTFDVHAVTGFNEAPVLRINYIAGSLQTIVLRLPLVLAKFLHPVTSGIDSEAFFKRWKQIGGANEYEGQRVFQVAIPGNRIDLRRDKNVLESIGWGILDKIDPNPQNLVGAAILSVNNDKIGTLLRLEPNLDRMVVWT